MLSNAVRSFFGIPSFNCPLSSSGGYPSFLEEFREMLTAWGLPVVASGVKATGLAEMRDAVAAVSAARETLPYPIDGAVVKVAATAEQGVLGASRSAPRWAVAVKFAPERAATRLRDITLQIGRTGVITPVAELEPVRLGGSRVTRASLHNADEIARRDLRIGDMVFVEKADDIIPAVMGVDRSQRSAESRPYVFPETCPACGGRLEREAGQVAHRCVSVRCMARVIRQLEHFAGAMDIRGLGPATLAALVERGKAGSAAELYRLRKEDLLPLPGFGQRSTEDLLAAIEASRERRWEKVVFALGIPGAGRERARLLAVTFPTFEALARADLERLTARETAGGAGLGEAMAASVFAHLQQPETQALLHELSLVLRPSSVLVSSGPLAGEIVVVSGRLDRWTRAEVTARLREAGAEVSSSVTGKRPCWLRAKSLGRSSSVPGSWAYP